MLTLFSIPKPFNGPIADVQRTAVMSWASLGDEVQVVLLGDEEGVAEAARRCGVEHVPEVAGNERGVPTLDSALACADRIARYPLRCFVNADVVLLDDFLPAVRRAVAVGERFLLVGETLDLDHVEPAELADPARLRTRALATGVKRGAAALDYFVFPAGLFGVLPPFLVGRACFDNWLVWRGRQQGVVIDASDAVLAIHQGHDYSHLAGGKDEAYYGEEAALNRALAGGGKHLFTLYDASHRLRADGTVVRNLGAILRIRETLRKSRAKLQLLVGARPRATR